MFYLDGYGVNDVVWEMKKVEVYLLKLLEVKKVLIIFGSILLCYYLVLILVGLKLNFVNVLVELNDSKYIKEYEEKFDVYMKVNFLNVIICISLFKLLLVVDVVIEIGFIGFNVDMLVVLIN